LKPPNEASTRAKRLEIHTGHAAGHCGVPLFAP
jgi:hypothetical protein